MHVAVASYLNLCMYNYDHVLRVMTKVEVYGYSKDESIIAMFRNLATYVPRLLAINLN